MWLANDIAGETRGYWFPAFAGMTRKVNPTLASEVSRIDLAGLAATVASYCIVFSALHRQIKSVP